MSSALAPYSPNGAMTSTDLAERRRLLANVIMRNGNEAQVDLVMSICGRYNLDPLLKHVVLINGTPYVTRDGLLHVAHASGKFDGIDVELRNEGGEWSATCTVWRKDMTRPIKYTVYQKEHQQGGGGAWGKYPRAMLTKTAEVAALRRAFDVSLGAVEELGYDGEHPQSSIGQVVTVEPQALPDYIEPDPLPEMDPEAFLALFAALEADFLQGTERSFLLDDLRARKDEMSDEQFARSKEWWQAFKRGDRVGMAVALGQPVPLTLDEAGVAG